MATTDNPSACTEAGDSSSVDEEHEVQLASRIEKLGTVCRESSMVGAALDTGSAVKERCKKKTASDVALVKAGLHNVYHTVLSKNALVLCNSSNNNSNMEPMAPTNSSTLPGCGCLHKNSRHSSASCFHKGGGVEVSLDGKSLWDEFCRRGTEMIVNRAGRRMFPGFSVAISCLKPKVKYSMKLEVVLADNHRFKFLNSKWLAVGSAEPQAPSETYMHPDSPNSGAFWMRHGVSFRKLKITNNKERPGTNALLYSMHKYFLRLIVEEEGKNTTEGRLISKVIARLSFPETTFIAVTAYQNEEVTQLKITNNPFAKAFRENTTDVDWETAQMFCSPGGSPYQQTEHHLSSPLIAGGNWPFASPLMSSPSTLLSASLPLPFSLPGLTSSNGTGSTSMYTPYTPQYSCPHHFQWPLPPPPPLSALTPPVLHYGQTSPYSQQPSVAGGVASSYYQHLERGRQQDNASKTVNLPDFETVFTPSK